MTNKKFIISALALLTAAGVYAQSLSWNQAIETIEHNNLRLRQLGKEYESQNISNMGSANTLEPTELEFEHLWGADSQKKWNIGVSQSFEWPGVYSRRKDAAKKWSQAYKQLYLAEVFDLRYDAMTTFCDLTYCNRRLSLLTSMLEKMESLQEYIETGFDQGQLTILDVKKIQLEIYNLKSEIADLEQLRDGYISALTVLNSGETLDVDCKDYAIQPLYTLSDYEQYAASAPLSEALKKQADATNADARALRTELNPGFKLGYVHAYEEHTHFNGMSVGIGLPFFSRTKASNAANLQAQALLLQQEQTSVENQAAVNRDYNNVLRQRTQFEQLRAVTLENDYPDLLLMAYKGGQINVLTYIQECTYFLNARKDYLKAEYEMNMALTRLNKNNPVSEMP